MRVLTLFLAVMGFFAPNVFALDIFIRTDSGEILLIDAVPADTVEDIESLAEQFGCCPEELRRDVFQNSIVAVNSLTEESELQPEAAVARDYLAPLTHQEKEDISYIVNTLSDQPTPKLLFYKSSLNQAGERVNHVHPLNFMAAIFADKLLRVKIRNVKRKGWVWSDFMGGLRNSLNEEMAKSNLKQEYFEDFAARVEIDYQKIEKPALMGKWDDLVNVLIKHSESQGDNDRYRM